MKKVAYSIGTTITLIALLLSGLQSKAQNVVSGIIPDIQPSPQAVAFNRLGDYQVNNNYGVPDINIPLFEIDFHGYKIPLTLHYEASPLKPGYNYDVTGLGWTLSGNSCVSRTIKDRADEYVFLNNSSPFTLDTFNDHLGMPKMYVDYKDMLHQLNYQFDSYIIVLPSGRTIPFFMYMGEDSIEYNLMPSDIHVKINSSYETSGIGSINAFTVTDEKGVTYHFTVADKASTGFDNDPNARRNVTWLLTSIDIPAKGTIYYQYSGLHSIQTYTVEEPVLRVSRLMSQRLEDAGRNRFEVSSPPQPECPRYEMRLLRSICYGPTRIDFNYMSDSCHMKEIVVSDLNSTIRKYALNITGSSSYGLNLTSLVITGQNDEDRLVYGFTYWNSNPGNHIDYWGNRCNSNSPKDLGNFNMYFNNEEDGHMYLSRNDLITQLSEDNLAQLIDNEEGDPYYYYKIKLQSTPNGDTRQPTSPELHGVLKRITYPNGGYTDFSFENHRFPTATAADGDFVFDRRSQRIIEGGGFRIKSIVNYTANDSIASEYHYRYGFTLGDIIRRNFPLPLPGNLNFNDTVNRHIGCGEAVVDPNLLTFMTFSYYDNAPFNNFRQFQKMALGQDSEIRNMINPQGGATWWDAYFSANTFRALLGGRRPVVYPEITVYHGNPDTPAKCKSKTVYKYDIYTVHHDQHTYYLLSFDQSVTADTAYFERTYYDFFSDAPALMCDNYESAKRHQLKLKSDYSFNSVSGKWNLISEKAYSYKEESMSEVGWIFNSPLSRENRSNYSSPFGNNPWLTGHNLSEFYIQVPQWLGRYTIDSIFTTTLRPGGTRTVDNIQKEVFSYLYPGVLKERDYTDLYHTIRCDFGSDYDKQDVYSYIGQMGNSDPVIAEMQSRNMLASLVYAETFTAIPQSSMTSGSKVDYAFYGNNILPYKLYENQGDGYDERFEVLSYDAYGNPTEVVDLKTGTHTVFLWSSYGRYLTDMINNATLSQISGGTTGTSQTRYATLKTLLPNAQIQTWDYLPLIGVSSHTDVNGQTILYEYDGLGRMKSEKRIVNGMSQPETLHEYEYNYLNPSL